MITSCPGSGKRAPVHAKEKETPCPGGCGAYLGVYNDPQYLDQIVKRFARHTVWRSALSPRKRNVQTVGNDESGTVTDTSNEPPPF